MLRLQKEGLCFWLYKLLCGCCLDKDDYWKFERAPEPTDVNWENMGLTACDSCLRQFASLIGTFLMIAISFIAIYFIKDYAKEMAEEAEEAADDIDLTDLSEFDA